MELTDRSKPAIKNLHVIRGIAALIVVFYHAKFALWVGGKEYLKVHPLEGPFDYALFSADMLTSCGKQCVIVFFLLSAFVIKYSFERNRLSIQQFYVIRAVRIYVPYIASLLFSGLMLYLAIRYFDAQNFPGSDREFGQRLHIAYENLNWLSFLKALIFLPEKEYFGFNIVYWSLLHEGIFYLLFPFYTRLKAMPLLLVFFVFLAVFALTGNVFLYFQLFFVAGLLIYEFLFNQNKRWPVRPLVFWIVLIFLYAVINLSVHVAVTMVPDVLTVLFYAWVVNYLMHSGNVGRGFTKLGDISYTLYLFHVPILLACYSVFVTFVPGITLYDRRYYYAAVLVCLICIYPFYILFEKRSLDLITFIKRKYGIH